VKPHNLSNSFRQARMQRFLSLVAPLMSKGPVRILDVGGTASYWHALPGLYRAPNVEITVCNLSREEHDDGNLRIRHGNACSLPFVDMAFDVVHSNSVIEHVGSWTNMKAMAGEVRRLAPVYFVQTPNYWFPLEPHFRLPFVQFLPRPLHNRLRDSIWPGQTVDLLTARKMCELFPDAILERERFAYLTKSLIAIRSA
jgi:hypothetical protein